MYEDSRMSREPRAYSPSSQVVLEPHFAEFMAARTSLSAGVEDDGGGAGAGVGAGAGASGEVAAA